MNIGFDSELLPDFVARQTQPVWVLIDGVNCAVLPEFLQRHHGISLYKASNSITPAHAPWLLRLHADSRLVDDLAMLPTDMHWGFLFTSAQSSDRLRTHFRRFTMMWIDGRSDLEDAPIYFRFYDPRVMIDCFEALDPAHLASLLQPVQHLALPLSPMMGESCGISPLAPRSAFRERVLTIDCPAHGQEPAVTTFRISGHEFQAFGTLQRQRATRKLARELHQIHPHLPDSLILHTARLAADRAGHYGLESIRQVHLYAECMLWHGDDFDRRIPQARLVLMKDDMLAWRKAAALEAWFVASKTTAPTMPRHEQV